MSPLLFCIVEDVLSRGLTQLVSNNRIKLIKSTRDTFVPSHTLYADDIMLFTKGSFSIIGTIKGIFSRYDNCSGQTCNPFKSILYVGSMSLARRDLLASIIGFSMGQMPFTYLGVLIFKGMPKSPYFQPITDKIKKQTCYLESLSSNHFGYNSTSEVCYVGYDDTFSHDLLLVSRLN